MEHIYIIFFHIAECWCNPLANDKFLDMSKLKSFADDKVNIAKMTISHCDRNENMVGKEENAEYGHFLLFPL